MIKYRANVCCAMCRWLRITLRLRTFLLSLCIALPAAIFSAILGVLAARTSVSPGEIHSTAYSSFSFTLGFLMVFRTGQAYSRFWDGCGSIHRMMGDFLNATSASFAYCRFSKAEPELIRAFQQRLVRLMSILNAMVLAELEGEWEGEERHAFRFDLLDAQALDENSLRIIAKSQHKPELLQQWIQGLIVEQIDTGVMSIAPPLLTRVFQELGSGMQKYDECVKYAEVPIPFPYRTICEVMLGIHTCMTPIMLSCLTTPVYAAVFSFVTLFVFWNLHLVAGELENPFESDANDLDVQEMQFYFNQRLVELLTTCSTSTPQLVVPAHAAESHLLDLGMGSTPRENLRDSKYLAGFQELPQVEVGTLETFAQSRRSRRLHLTGTLSFRNSMVFPPGNLMSSSLGGFRSRPSASGSEDAMRNASTWLNPQRTRSSDLEEEDEGEMRAENSDKLAALDACERAFWAVRRRRDDVFE